MKHATVLLCTFVLLAVYNPASSQQLPDPEKGGPSLLGSNAEGNHFIVGFMQNEESDCDGYFSGTQSVAVASRFNTMVQVRYPDGRTIKRVVPANRVVSFSFDGWQYECIGEGICPKSIELIADDPVSIYCFSSKTHTSDGYLALPVSSWGTEYHTANYHNDHYDIIVDPNGGFVNPCNAEPRRGEFAVIAAEDSTIVEIWPQAETREGGMPGSSIRKTLMKGEMWQVQDAGDIRGASDITGSRIVSSKPVGLLSGHMRTAIPYTHNTKDHLVEMLPPTSSYGKRYIIVPFGGRGGGDVVRVITSEPGITNARVINNFGVANYRINQAGSFQEIHIPQDRVTVIETDQPVLTAHYSQSNGVDLESLFDPYMIVVTPEEQFVNSAIFQTMPDNERWIEKLGLTPDGRDTIIWVREKQFTQHFVTLVVERNKIDQLEFNGSPLLNYPAIVNSGQVPSLESTYTWLTLRLPGGEAFTIHGEALFGGYVYGIGEFDSYGWPVGAGLRDLENPDTLAPQIEASPNCGKSIYDLVITDDEKKDWGLRKVWLDEDASSNVETSTTYPCVCGLDKYEMQVRLIDPEQPGQARIIAEDDAGNLDTIDLELSTVPPAFSSAQIEMRKAELNVLYTEKLTISNPSATEMIRLDSFRLQSGTEFEIVGIGKGGAIDRTLAPDNEYPFEISFITDKEGLFEDTLLVYADCRVYKIPVRAFTIAPYIDTEDLDFGAIRVGRIKCLEMTVTNTGDAPLRIDEVRVNGKRGTFTFDRNNVPKDTIWLEPGESRIVIVCFEPDATEDFDGTVEFVSNARGGKSEGSLKGRGIYPELLIKGYDFGDIQIGDTACAEVPVVNTGSDTAFLTSLLINDNIFVEDTSILPFALPPGDTIWVPVCFAPAEEKIYGSLLGANNTDGLEATDSLRGSGYRLLAEIDGYDWQKRWVGTQHDTIVHIRNLASRAIRIDSVWLDSGDLGDFVILTQIPSAITLNPNEEYPIEVRFTPLVRGARIVGIYAGTSSRLRPLIENTLKGFGIQAVPGDELVHDISTAYSCETRTSRILLYNRGNADLTIETISIENADGTASLNAPNPGYQIPEGGDPLELEVTFDFAGYSGTATAIVTWSFKELPGETWNRTITLSSEPQQYEISAVAPPRVDIGEEFDLLVTVDRAIWNDVRHEEVTLEITYNPAVSLFDTERWNSMTGATGVWTFVGQPVFPYPDSGVVQLTLKPSSGIPAMLTNTTFPAIPFRGFLGNKESDTFNITMQAGSQQCVLPSMTILPYSIEQICGLDTRLIVIAGDPPALRPGKPNPASSTINIEFTLPFEGHTRLELFSVDGKRIRRIIDGSVGSGDHIVVLDVSDLPNGVYYYRLEYGSYSATEQLIIRK